MATTTVVVQSQRPPYDKGTALFGSLAMAFFLGIHGFHRCYVGDGGLGCLMCMTCGGCWIWSIIDWINIEQIVDDACRRAGFNVNTTTTYTTTTMATPVMQPGVQVQTYPAQPYPAQPYPAQPYPAQPYPAQQPYPGQPQYTTQPPPY